MLDYGTIQLLVHRTATSAPVRVLPDGSGPNDHVADVSARARTFVEVVRWAGDTFGPRIRGATALKVFVAPEFYFRHGGPSDPAESLELSYPNGDLLLNDVVYPVLRDAFGGPEYADWLFVPGSMIWHRPAGTRGGDRPVLFNTVSVLRGGPVTEPGPPAGPGDTAAAGLLALGTISAGHRELRPDAAAPVIDVRLPPGERATEPLPPRLCIGSGADAVSLWPGIPF